MILHFEASSLLAFGTSLGTNISYVGHVLDNDKICGRLIPAHSFVTSSGLVQYFLWLSFISKYAVYLKLLVQIVYASNFFRD